MKLFLAFMFMTSVAQAVELKGRDSSISVLVPLPAGLAGGMMTPGLGSGFGTPPGPSEVDLTSLGSGPFGMGIGGVIPQSTDISLKLYKNGTVVGQHKLSGIDNKELNTLRRNAVLLNRYIEAGAEVDIPANPTTRDISLAVQRIESSNRTEILRAKITLLERERDEMSEALVETVRNCVPRNSVPRAPRSGQAQGVR